MQLGTVAVKLLQLTDCIQGSASAQFDALQFDNHYDRIQDSRHIR